MRPSDETPPAAPRPRVSWTSGAPRAIACAARVAAISTRFCGKALKKEPAERYQTVTAFADDVRRHLRNEPVTARPDSVWYRTRTFARRHRLEIGALAGIVLALIVGTGIAVTQARASARARDHALEQLRRAGATNDLSSFLLSQATPRGRPISNVDLLAAGEWLIAKRFANDSALRVHMLLTLADRYQENQQFDDWRRVLQRAYDDSRGLADPGLRAYATCGWAAHFAEQGHFADALTAIAGALSALATTPDSAAFESGCRVLESIAARLSGDTARAIAAAERAVALEQGRMGAPGRELEPSAALASAFASAYEVPGRRCHLPPGDGHRRRARPRVDTASGRESEQLERHAPECGPAAGRVRGGRTSGASRARGRLGRRRLALHADDLRERAQRDRRTGRGDTGPRRGPGEARGAGSPRRLIATLSTAILAACEAGDEDRGTRLLAEAQRALAEDTSAYSRGIVEASAARVALARGDRGGSAELARRAVVTLDAATPGKVSLLPAQTFLARSLNASGRFTDALVVAERSVALAKTRLSHQAHTAAMGLALLEVAVARHGLGETTRARVDVAAALEHLLPSVGPKARATERAEALRRQL